MSVSSGWAFKPVVSPAVSSAIKEEPWEGKEYKNFSASWKRFSCAVFGFLRGLGILFLNKRNY
jgi:hypothetical protein